MRRLISSPWRSPASSSTIKIFVMLLPLRVLSYRGFLARHAQDDGSWSCRLRLERAQGVVARARWTGEQEAERRSGARLRLHLDPSAVRGDDLLHERQAEAGAAARLRI